MGALILLAAAGVVVQTIRRRRSSASPLPILLITFGLIYDAMITQGRAGLGPIGALSGNRYVLANLLVLLGIVVFALGYVPLFVASLGHDGQSAVVCSRLWRVGVGSALGVLAAFLVVQVGVATPFGIHNGFLTKAVNIRDARVLVNLERYPRSAWACALDVTMFSETAPSTSRALKMGVPILADARADRFAIFQPNQYRIYRLAGPPSLSGTCTSPGRPPPVQAAPAEVGRPVGRSRSLASGSA